MKFLQILTTALGFYLAGSGSFRLGNFNVAVSLVGGGPVHLTLAAALLAVEKVLAGATGTFQSGSIQIVISEIAPA